MQNQYVEVATSIARVASWAARISNLQGRFGRLVIDVTAIVTAPSVVVSIREIDRVSGKRITILDSVALVGAGTTVLRVGPALTAAANLVANDFMPVDLEIVFTHANGDSITYSAGLELVQ
jgi:hypothetical protein